MKFNATIIRNGINFSQIEIDANDREDATAQLRAQGYVLLSLKRAAGWTLGATAHRLRFPLALFSQQLLALQQAGLSVVEALETLADKETHPDIARVLRRIVAALYEGQSLSHAIEHCGAAIPPLYVATLRSSERTGALEEALQRYIDYQAQVDRLRRHLAGASVYPVVLAVVGSLVTLFLMLYVVPRFSSIYADAGADAALGFALS